MAPPIRKFLDEIIATLRPMGPPTLVADSPETLLRFAAMTTCSTIEDQLQRASARRKIATDTRVRYATDEFTAGYAIGAAMTAYWMNGAEIKSAPLDKIMKELNTRLSALLPKIDITKAYRSASAVFAGGVVAGASDPGLKEERQFLEYVWKLLSEHTQMYAHNLADYAIKDVGLHYQMSDFIMDAGRIIFERYMAARG